MKRLHLVIKQTFYYINTIRAIAGLVLLSCLACEAPYHHDLHMVDRQYALRDFNTIQVSDAIELELSQGGSYQVTAVGDSDDLDFLAIKVRNRQLVAYCTRHRVFGNRKIKIFITLPELKALELSGASNGQITDFGNMKIVNLTLSGVSKLQVDMPIETLNMELSGASTIYLASPVRNIRADLAGASVLEAFEANCQNGNLELSGASKADIAVDDLLTVKASGASKVRYLGNPSIAQDLSGGSKLVKLAQ